MHTVYINYVCLYMNLIINKYFDKLSRSTICKKYFSFLAYITRENNNMDYAIFLHSEMVKNNINMEELEMPSF